MNIKSFYKDINYDFYIKSIKVSLDDDLNDSIFVCIKGNNFDTHEYINKIIEKGCKLIVSEIKLDCKIPYIIVEDTRLELARLCHIMYYSKIKNLKLIGVTGTDGKTTTSTFIYHILKHLESSYIGTNGVYYLDKKLNTKNTTLNILDNYRFFKDFIYDNINYVSMEISSHAIKQKRVDFLYFKYKIFTNLSHEHFDEFKDIDNYYNVKKEFFNKYNKNDTISIINIDDPFGKKLYNEIKSKKISFGKDEKADFIIISIKLYSNQSNFSFIYKNKLYSDFMINFMYEYNVYNVIPSIIIGLEEFLTIDFIKNKLLDINKIDGRNEVFKIDNFTVIIDFSHTPNSIEQTLKSLKKYYKYNKIIHIFGCAGNKDKSKRALMGNISTKYSDYTIFTSEDNYSENKIDIINMLISDVSKDSYEIVYDRKEAILKGLNIANNGDLVIITGKGNEDKINIDNVYYEYSDISVINEYNDKKNKG